MTKADKMEELLHEIREWLEGHFDTVDGPNGQPYPNAAMSFAQDIDEILGRAP